MPSISLKYLEGIPLIHYLSNIIYKAHIFGPKNAARARSLLSMHTNKTEAKNL